MLAAIMMVSHVTPEAKRLNIRWRIVRNIAVDVMSVQPRPCATYFAKNSTHLLRSPSVPRFGNSVLRIRTRKRAEFPSPKRPEIFQSPIETLSVYLLSTRRTVFRRLLLFPHRLILQARPANREPHQRFYPRRVQLPIARFRPVVLLGCLCGMCLQIFPVPNP